MENERNSKSKIIIIALLVIIVAIVSVSAYFLISGQSAATGGEVVKKSKDKDEYTILLDEFVTNLKSEKKGKDYLKIQVAIMTTDKKSAKAIEEDTNKIRDIVLNDLRGKTSEQILEVEKTDELKNQILGKLNKALGDDIIEELYFTNLVVQ